LVLRVTRWRRTTCGQESAELLAGERSVAVGVSSVEKLVGAGPTGRPAASTRSATLRLTVLSLSTLSAPPALSAPALRATLILTPAVLPAALVILGRRRTPLAGTLPAAIPRLVSLTPAWRATTAAALRLGKGETDHEYRKNGPEHPLHIHASRRHGPRRLSARRRQSV
jgi:hypothetical protein